MHNKSFENVAKYRTNTSNGRQLPTGTKSNFKNRLRLHSACLSQQLKSKNFSMVQLPSKVQLVSRSKNSLVSWNPKGHYRVHNVRQRTAKQNHRNEIILLTKLQSMIVQKKVDPILYSTETSKCYKCGEAKLRGNIRECPCRRMITSWYLMLEASLSRSAGSSAYFSLTAKLCTSGIRGPSTMWIPTFNVVSRVTARMVYLES
jgi:hypothetical protein